LNEHVFFKLSTTYWTLIHIYQTRVADTKMSTETVTKNQLNKNAKIMRKSKTYRQGSSMISRNSVRQITHSSLGNLPPCEIINAPEEEEAAGAVVSGAGATLVLLAEEPVAGERS
jgi:hypothetical protein